MIGGKMIGRALAALIAKYPKTIAAAKGAEHSQWALGDALLAECGPPALVQYANDGSRAKVAEASKAIMAAIGADYTPETLTKIRAVSFKYPQSFRNEIAKTGIKVSFWAFEEAGHHRDSDAAKECVRALVARAKRTGKGNVSAGDRGDVRKYEAMLAHQLERERAKHRKMQDEALKRKAEAAERKLAAKTEAERKAAERDLEKAKRDLEVHRVPPTRDDAAQSLSDAAGTPLLLVYMDVNLALDNVKAQAEYVRDTIKKCINQFGAEDLAAFAEGIDECAAILDAARDLCGGKSNKPKLSVVK